MESGYIKLSRKLNEWEWRKDPNTVTVWLYILLNANWKSGRFKGQEIKRGQLIITIAGLSKAVGITPKQARIAIEHLQRTGEIRAEGRAKYGTLVTVEKYALYQCEENGEGKQRANKGQIKGKQRANIEESKKVIKKDIYTGKYIPPPYKKDASILDALGGDELDNILSQIKEDEQQAYMDLLIGMRAEGKTDLYQYAVTVARNNGFIE